MHTDASAAQYEKNQSRNPINTWLHSFRFRHVLDVVDSLGPGPLRVVEIGSAHGKLFEVLNERCSIDYTGIELDPLLTKIATDRHGHHTNFRAIAASAVAGVATVDQADVVIALETLEHIPGSECVRTVEAIARLKPKRFICSVPVEIGPAIWCKNIGSLVSGYSRHTEYTWRETFWAGLYQLDRLPPHGNGHKGFDWRWLAQTIRHNMRIREIRRFPFGLPAALSTSVFIVAEHR